MMRNTVRRAAVTAVTAGVVIGMAFTGAVPALGYQPDPAEVYVADDPASCNKRPCVLYPKTAQLSSGRIVAAFENSQSPVVGQTMPVMKSDDYGTTWQELAEVPAPAYLSDAPEFAPYTSNWTNPNLYELPGDVGELEAGTLLLSTVVSGDDEYLNDRRAADPAWQPDGDGDRRDLAIALFSSTDDGESWDVVNIIAEGGWQGGSAGRIGNAVSAANTFGQFDPVWEPHLMYYEGQLVAYYSDENDYLGYDPQTGVAIIDPDNDTAPDSGGQILAHRTWDGAGDWSDPVVDVPGLVQDRGDGKTQIGGGRPGMTTVVPTTDGRWLMTHEYFGGGNVARYRISDDPLRFFEAEDRQISTLPAAAGNGLQNGGSPVLTTFPDGRIIYNADGSGDVWVNETGRSDGEWTRFRSTLPAGYSRNIQYVEGTGRLLILHAAWAGNSIGPVRHADLDLGNSDGSYYTLVNRATGQALGTGGRSQDPPFTGDVPDIATEDLDAAVDTQKWHLVAKGENTTFLNKGGGRALAIWFGNAQDRQPLAQWVDDNASDKLWSVEAGEDGSVRIRSAGNAALYVTATGSNSPVELRTAISGDQAAAAQEWVLQREAPTEASLLSRGELTDLAPAQVTAGSELPLTAGSSLLPSGAIAHAGKTAAVYVLAADGSARELGSVTLDDAASGVITTPADLAGGDYRVVLAFDDAAPVWDTIEVLASAVAPPGDGGVDDPVPAPSPVPGSGGGVGPGSGGSSGGGAPAGSTPSQGDLAATGSNVDLSPLVAGLALLAAGIGALVLRRRSRRVTGE